MSVTILLARALPTHVHVMVSPLAELAACLHAITEAEHHPHFAAWGASVLESASTGFLQETRQFAPLWSAYRARIFYPQTAHLTSTEPTLDDEIELLRTTGPERLHTFLVWACVGGYSRASGVSAGTAAGNAELLDLAAALSTRRLELLERLLAHPEQLLEEIAAYLATADKLFFAERWKQVRPRLVKDAYRVESILQREGVPAAFRSLAGATVLGDPARVVVGKFTHQIIDAARKGIILVPTTHGSPHFLVKAEPGETPLIQYPITGSPSSSIEQTMRRLQALSEPTRWTLCRLIAREALSTTEIAKRTRMTEPQVSRHLRRLRELDLVTVETANRRRYYRLDIVAVARLGWDVVGALQA